MSASARDLVCSRCERPVPHDRSELERWKHGELVLAGQVDDATAAMLLCPECDAELRDVTYDEGGGG